MLSIINNPVSVTARGNLSAANKSLSKSIERLSSGLRINGAADDPSGLSISERLRTQINGFGRASLNAQDAISYFQTAEGALNETHSILQRMRELSIQAANGTLTSSDRGQIQQEVNQLKDEVDRISSSTEFNTKKLLNGDAAGLWSSSSSDVKAIIRGKVAEGNYKLEINQTPVENHVLKTDIFSVKDGVQAVKNVDLDGSKAKVQGIANSAAATDLTFTFDDGTVREFTASRTNSTSVNTLVDAINNDEVLSKYVKATLVTMTDTSGAGSTIKIEALNEGEYGNSFQVVNNSLDTAGSVASTFGFAASTAVQTFSAGKTSATGVVDVYNPEGLINGADGTATYTMTIDVNAAALASATATYLAAYAQSTTEGFTSNSTIRGLHIDTASVQTGANGAYFQLEVLETKGNSSLDTTSSDTVKVKFSFDNGKTWTEKTIDMGDYADTTASTGGVELSDGVNSVRISTTDSNFAFNAGDKLLYGLNAVHTSTADETLTITSPISDGKSTPAATQTSRTYNFLDGSLNSASVTLDVVQLDAHSGSWNSGKISFSTKGHDASDGSVKFDVESGGIATENTELYKLDKFYDADGNFILGEHGKDLTIYNGEGKSTTIHIDGQDTVADFVSKINDGIKDGLGMGTGNSEVDNHIASFVTSATADSDEAVKGTIVIRSTQMGENGKLFFSGDEDLLNAMSLATINDPGKDPMTVKVSDAHTGKLIDTVTTSDNTLHNVIEGVNVEINANVDSKVEWDGTKKQFKFSSKPGTTTEYLHVVDNAKSFQIGANQNQTMESFIGNMSAHALGVDKVMVFDQTVAQQSIGRLDEAIDKVSSERARIGAVVNRLDHTINNLNVQQENAISSESRIRDLDIAKEATKMTKNQILSQAATSMLAQAKQMSSGLLSLLR